MAIVGAVVISQHHAASQSAWSWYVVCVSAHSVGTRYPTIALRPTDLGSPDVFRSCHLTSLRAQATQGTPPPVRRVGEEDDYDSDEERETEMIRQREATMLSPELTRIVETFSGPKATSPLHVQVVSYLQPVQAQSALILALHHRSVGVRDHALSFYRDVARAVCRRLHLPYVDLLDPSTNCQLNCLAHLRRVLAACASSIVVVDGYPCLTLEAPYATQQLFALETSHTANMQLCVRFRASLDVLLEKYPIHDRNALEDTQDAVEDEPARDIDAALAKRKVRDVSCEREPQDAEDAFIDVLTSCGLVE